MAKSHTKTNNGPFGLPGGYKTKIYNSKQSRSGVGRTAKQSQERASKNWKNR